MSPTQPAHVRAIQTPDYVGDRGAIIFVIDEVDSGSKQTIDRIIRLFAENKAVLNVAIPFPATSDNFSSLEYLLAYYDAGIVDICIDGNEIEWLEYNSTKNSQAYNDLKSSWQKSRGQLDSFFGEAPVSCIIPSDYLDEVNYALLQDSGFKVIAGDFPTDFKLSIEPLSWTGANDPAGLYRVPIIGAIDYIPIPVARGLTPQASQDKKWQTEAGQKIDVSSAAVFLIHPSSFTGKDGMPDPALLSQLSKFIKSCQNIWEIATLESWFQYTYRWTSGTVYKQRVVPVYNGGLAIIFRVDDVSVGWHEDVVEEIVKLFQRNGVPVDLGVVSNVEGTNSYKMPWLQKYIDIGAVGISVHGYDWTYYQFDTSQELKSKRTVITDPCYNPGISGGLPIPKETLTYAYIKFKLVKARDEYLQYFGFAPVALTVPTDFFDETGYRAIQNAGFKVFSTQVNAEPHSSVTKPVDYFGIYAPDGMYRVPTATDVCTWDNCTWGDIFDITNVAAITDYCKLHHAWEDIAVNDFGAMLCGVLGELGVTAVGVHPDAFVGPDGKPDKAKLEKLDKIIKWCKTFATITTFEAWYNYTSATNRR